MTTYEIIRCIGILVGPTVTLLLGGFIAWVIRMERMSSRALTKHEQTYALYEKNIPEMHDEQKKLDRRIAAIEKRLSIARIDGPTHVAQPSEKGTTV
jgi:hypothetical protein